MKHYLFYFMLLLLALGAGGNVNAHCDTMDGPVVADAKKALDSNNVNYVLKWVHPEGEAELKQIFDLAMKVRTLGQDARKLADMYFFETLVRIHRNGEGVAYTGIKPEGTPVEEKIKAADESIEKGNLTPLESLISHDELQALEEPFKSVLALKNFDVNDVKAGRAYVEAYVKFFHMAEGEATEGHHSSSVPHSEHL